MARRRVAGHSRLTPRANTEKATKGGSNLPGGLTLPGSGVATDASRLLATLQAQTAQPQMVDTTNRPLPRDHGFGAPFGPGAPLYPAPLNPANPATGQPDPRRWEYPVSWNLLGHDQKLVDWATLRSAGDSVDVIRRCIEIRKTELTSLEWDIAPSKRAMQRAGARTPAEQAAMREKYADDISRAVDFWTIPDRQNGLSFSDWLWMLLEEYFVLDALSIYPRMTLGRQLHSLNVIDGSTIKPLLDELGNTPLPPAPAYQQYLWGFPRGEYAAGDNPDFEADAGTMLYRPRHRRTWTPYGYSPVEQALVSADLWLHRQGWMRSEYTEGTLPVSFLKTDLQAAGMTPEQIRSWEVALNDFYFADNANRHRFRLLPMGYEPVLTADASERYKPDYDEFLVKLLASHFGVDGEELGISPRGGLGGAGYEEAREKANHRRDVKPITEWLTDLFDHVSQRFLGLPRELTFTWPGMEQEDEKQADETGGARVEQGRMTLNEERDRLGLERYDGEWADKPFMHTATGPVWLEDAYDDALQTVGPMGLPPQGAMPAEDGAMPADGQDPAGGGRGGGGDGRSRGQGLPSSQPRSIRQRTPDRFALNDNKGGKGDRDADGDGLLNEGKADGAVLGELEAFGRFIAKRDKVTRPFQFEHLTDEDPVVAEQLNQLAETDPARARAYASQLIAHERAKADGGGARGRGEAPAGRADPAGPRPRGGPAPAPYQAGFSWDGPSTEGAGSTAR